MPTIEQIQAANQQELSDAQDRIQELEEQIEDIERENDELHRENQNLRGIIDQAKRELDSADYVG